jgi:hypothetical protein
MLCPEVSGLWDISICNKHLGLWLARAQPGEVKSRTPPRVHTPTGLKDYFFSQIPPWDDDYSHPDCLFDGYTKKMISGLTGEVFLKSLFSLEVFHRFLPNSYLLIFPRILHQVLSYTFGHFMIDTRPVIVKAMGEDAEFREEIKEMIDGGLMLIEGEVE